MHKAFIPINLYDDISSQFNLIYNTKKAAAAAVKSFISLRTYNQRSWNEDKKHIKKCTLCVFVWVWKAFRALN